MAIHRLPAPSKATLSGHGIGETFDLSNRCASLGVTARSNRLSARSHLRPAGSAAVRSSGGPAAAPVSGNLVDGAVIRRL